MFFSISVLKGKFCCFLNSQATVLLPLKFDGYNFVYSVIEE